jgi:hypothetical protein
MLKNQLATIKIDALVLKIASSFFAHMGAAWRFPLGVTPPCDLLFMNEKKFIYISSFFCGAYEGTVEVAMPFKSAKSLFTKLKQRFFSSNHIITNEPLFYFLGYITTNLTSRIAKELNKSEFEHKNITPTISQCDQIRFYELAANRNALLMEVEKVPLILAASIFSNETDY